MISQKGYYSMKDMSWMGIKDMVIVGAMGNPGGARTLPSARLLRHFNIIHVTDLSQEN
jgi:dynein heavy chain